MKNLGGEKKTDSVDMAVGGGAHYDEKYVSN